MWPDRQADVLPESVVCAAPDPAPSSVPMLPTAVFREMSCSRLENCANWLMNCVPSVGFSGFWFLICATRSCRNTCSFPRALEDVSAEELFEVVPEST